MNVLVAKVLDVLFPPMCAGCGSSGVFLCQRCVAALPPPERVCAFCAKICPDAGICGKCAHIYGIVPLKIYWTTHYKNSAVEWLVRTFKYRSATTLTDTLGNLLYERTRNVLDSIDVRSAVIIPVPLSEKKLRERGFNQAELLSRYIANKTTIPMQNNVLVKIKHTLSQVGVAKRAERLKNLQESFAVDHPEIVTNKTVILIDDIITTGATIIETSHVLQKAGSKDIIALVVAH